MRFFHLSDLHIGRQLNGYSLRDNQEAVLSQIVDYAERERPDAILICGDIYDKSVPSGEAVTVFDRFLNALSDLKPEIPVLIIAGNHDSPERLSYASAFLEKHRIFLSAMPPREQDEHLKKVTLSDEWGEVDFYLLPFMKPGYVRPLIGDGAAAGYESAFQAVLAREDIDDSKRNVILAHQFFTAGGSGPELSDSEQTVLTAGGLDQIGVSVLEPFDYAALGHIHGPQRVGEERFRYCGTPYPYSVSEEHHKKSVTVVTLGKKGEAPLLETLPLAGLQRVRRVTGPLSQVIAAARTADPEAGKCSDFVSITLTDEEERFDFREQLEEAYDHILEIRIDNERVRNRMAEDTEQLQVLNPYEAFCQFYEAVRHCPMTEEQERLMKRIVEEAKEEEER